MKFGVYFAYWEHEWDADFSKYCKKVADLGFDVLEVAGAGLYNMNEAQLIALRQAAKDASIMLTCCGSLPKDHSAASEDEATRRRGIDHVKKLLDKMHIAGIDRVGGIYYAYWPADYSEPVNKELARAQSLKSVAEMADYAAQYGITLMLEVVNRFEQFIINDAAECVQYCKDLGKDNVKIMLDSFHMNIEEDSFGDAIKKAGSYLGHFHIGEANRKVPGRGHIPWKEIADALKAIDYDGCIVMEPFVMMGGGIGKDIRVWRDLSDNADEAQLDRDVAGALKFLKSQF